MSSPLENYESRLRRILDLLNVARHDFDMVRDQARVDDCEVYEDLFIVSVELEKAIMSLDFTLNKGNSDG